MLDNRRHLSRVSQFFFGKKTGTPSSIVECQERQLSMRQPSILKKDANNPGVPVLEKKFLPSAAGKIGLPVSSSTRRARLI